MHDEVDALDNFVSGREENIEHLLCNLVILIIGHIFHCACREIGMKTLFFSHPRQKQCHFLLLVLILQDVSAGEKIHSYLYPVLHHVI